MRCETKKNGETRHKMEKQDRIHNSISCIRWAGALINVKITFWLEFAVKKTRDQRTPQRTKQQTDQRTNRPSYYISTVPFMEKTTEMEEPFWES